MTWTSRILIPALLVIFSAAALSGLASGSDADNSTVNRNNRNSCQDCHNQQLGISGVDTERCSSCHENHGLIEPSRFSGVGRQRESIHDEHDGTNNQAGCKACHSPPSCNRCHGDHGTPGTKDCKQCHGELPDTKGHTKEASVFAYGKHNWMKCNNCHQSNQFHFRDFTFPFNESYKLCSVCHSKQANDEKHYRSSNYSLCANCHNPHSTSLKENTRLRMPDVRFDVSGVYGTFGNVGKMAEDNASTVMIGLILIASIVAEMVFKRK